MKNNYFGKEEKKYFSITKKDEELKDKGIKENSFDNYKNSTDKYKKTAMKIKIFKYDIKD